MRLRGISLTLLLTMVTVGCGSEFKRRRVPPPVTSEPSAPPSDNIPPSSPSPSPKLPQEGGIVEQQQFMIFHNLKRCWHSAPKIVWSDSLAAKSATIANACNFTYQGSNVSTGHGPGLDVVKALDQWYLEGMIYYPYGKNEIPADMRRFAAMIWKETKEVGCAKADCNGEPYFVCSYSQDMNKEKASQNVTGLKPDFLTCTGL